MLEPAREDGNPLDHDKRHLGDRVEDGLEHCAALATTRDGDGLELRSVRRRVGSEALGAHVTWLRRSVLRECSSSAS
jgi:hypothetical protein